MEQDIQLMELARKIQHFVIYRSFVRENNVLFSLLYCLDALEQGDNEVACDSYCEFVAGLYAEGGNLGKYLLEQVLNEETPILKKQVQQEAILPAMQECLDKELRIFSEISRVQPQQIASLLPQGDFFPTWENTAADFEGEYVQRLGQVSTKGYGVFAKNHMFTLGENQTLIPVKNPDPQTLQELTGYANERRKIWVNTLALLEGLPTNNVLLYGDAGTGKSSAVKAISNALYTKGLRLIEVRKNQLYEIPALMDSLAKNPLKFILFIDDLSFSSSNEEFRALKAILEGNISARPKNVAVYATSNRRHMVQQNFSDRRGDIVNITDTLQEESSLSARFGLVITFLRPEKDLYLEIVQNLAQEYGVQLQGQELFTKAEAHALRQGGRSPRTAKQFVEYCKAEESRLNH